MPAKSQHRIEKDAVHWVNFGGINAFRVRTNQISLIDRKINKKILRFGNKDRWLREYVLTIGKTKKHQSIHGVVGNIARWVYIKKYRP